MSGENLGVEAAVDAYSANVPAEEASEAPEATPKFRDVNEAYDAMKAGEGEVSEGDDAGDVEAGDDAEADPDSELGEEAEEGEGEPDAEGEADVGTELEAWLGRMPPAVRQQAEAMVQEAVQNAQAARLARQQYSTLLSMIGQQFQGLNAQQLEQLKVQDPKSYLQLAERHAAVTAEQQRLEAEAQSELRQQLAATFPHWRDPAVMHAETRDMAVVAHALGFTENEMRETLDPRAWQLLRIAVEGIRVMNRSRAAKSGELAPPSQKRIGVLKTRGARPTPRTTQHAQLKALNEKFRKTGSFDDAYKAYTAQRKLRGE